MATLTIHASSLTILIPEPRVVQITGVGKGEKELGKVEGFDIGELDAIDQQWVQGGAGNDGAAVVLYNNGGHGGAAIMEILRSERYVAQAGYAELERIGRKAGDAHTAIVVQLGVYGQAYVAVAKVGKQGFGVAGGALGLEGSIAGCFFGSEHRFAALNLIIL